MTPEQHKKMLRSQNTHWYQVLVERQECSQNKCDKNLYKSARSAGFSFLFQDFSISSYTLLQAVLFLPWGSESISIFHSRKTKLCHFYIPQPHRSIKIFHFCNQDLSHKTIFVCPFMIFKMNQVMVIQFQVVSCNKLSIQSSLYCEN